jgi:amyloid beta precursor protein binding protein 1
MYDDESVAPWYVCLQAVWQFYTTNGKFPGETEDFISSDLSALKEIAKNITRNIMSDGTINIQDSYLREMCRYSDSKIHSVAAFLGGVAS